MQNILFFHLILFLASTPWLDQLQLLQKKLELVFNMWEKCWMEMRMSTQIVITAAAELPREYKLSHNAFFFLLFNHQHSQAHITTLHMRCCCENSIYELPYFTKPTLKHVPLQQHWADEDIKLDRRRKLLGWRFWISRIFSCKDKYPLYVWIEEFYTFSLARRYW